MLDTFICPKVEFSQPSETRIIVPMKWKLRKIRQLTQVTAVKLGFEPKSPGLTNPCPWPGPPSARPSTTIKQRSRARGCKPGGCEGTHTTSHRACSPSAGCRHPVTRLPQPKQAPSEAEAGKPRARGVVGEQPSTQPAAIWAPGAERGYLLPSAGDKEEQAERGPKSHFRLKGQEMMRMDFLKTFYSR